MLKVAVETNTSWDNVITSIQFDINDFVKEINEAKTVLCAKNSIYAVEFEFYGIYPSMSYIDADGVECTDIDVGEITWGPDSVKISRVSDSCFQMQLSWLSKYTDERLWATIEGEWIQAPQLPAKAA